MHEKRNFQELFEQILDHWSPKIVGEVNDHYIKVAKIKNEFVWHEHPSEDEMFMVVKGEMELELEDRTVTLKEGEFFVVGKGTPHNPKAKEECWIMLFERKTTQHTGNKTTPLTKSIEDQKKG